MPKTGTRKVATKERFKNGKDTTQYCIDAVLVDEVLKSLPSDIEIIGCKVRLGTPIKRSKGAIPNKLKKYGVSYMCHILPTSEAHLVFDKVTPQRIKTCVKKVCEELGNDPKKPYFDYLTLRKGDATGRFQRTTKDMHPDERDLRKKAVVLGLSAGQGRVSSLISALGAKKFHCSVENITVRVVTCHV